jgi:hypothetical protein
MKRLLATGVAVTLTAALVFALATAAGGSAGEATGPEQGSDGAALRVEAQQTSLHVTGNTITLTEDFFADGKKVGSDQIACFLTGPSPLALCQAAAILPLGEITSQGSVAIPPSVGSSFTTAITGGTGAYRNVRGTIVATQTTSTSATDDFRVLAVTND